MNNKLIITASLLILSGSIAAQNEFANLSAKAKTEMAKSEEIESEKDEIFQELMGTGMEHFESNRFEEAISAFESAGNRRPINVYPPVMIEDVKLAMSVYVEEEIEEEPKEDIPEVKKEPEMTAEERVELMYQQELAKVYDNPPVKPKEEKTDPIEEQPERNAEGIIILEKEIKDSEPGGTPIDKSVEPEVIKEEVIEETETTVEEEMTEELPDVTEEKKEKVAVRSVDLRKTELEIEDNFSKKDLQEELASKYPDGVTEEQFKEGNRSITKRVVVKDGVGDEYRKVVHGWGGVFYFKNGESISERAWNQETVLKN